MNVLIKNGETPMSKNKYITKSFRIEIAQFSKFSRKEQKEILTQTFNQTTNEILNIMNGVECGKTTTDGGNGYKPIKTKY